MNFSTSALAKTGKQSAIALGCFDGVHLGHSEIISKAVEQAKKDSLLSVVWSFQTPPKSFFANKNDPQGLLTTLSEKKKLIRSLNVDTLICVPFNKNIAKLSPREFFEDILISRLNAKHIFCGFNYRFGYKGSGDVKLLASLCKEFGIDLTVLSEIKIENVTVSSTAIRSYLANGEPQKAKNMLGRPFSLRGKVKDGQHLGRKLGFPTVNQEVPIDKLLIKNGVYLTRVKFNGKTKFGVTNIGLRPTVQGKEPICETHILDFKGDLYGKYVTVEFLEFIRSETKFSNISDLAQQIDQDVIAAKTLINTKKYVF